MGKRLLIILLSISLSMLPITAKADEQDYYIDEIADYYDLNPYLIRAIIFYESSWDEDVINSQGCTGLMQISPKSHKARMERLGVTDLKDGNQNILVGCDLLAELFDKYGDVAMVLDAYHGNLKPKDWYVNNVSRYASKILTLSDELEITANRQEDN